MMFGLAYSVSRDSETNANKIVSFMPITSTKFMWSKILTYLIIGVFEMFLLLLAGVLFYNMDFQMNWLLIVSLSSMFVLSSIMLGMAFSLLKGQVLTVLCSVSVILIPLIILSNNIISGIILPIRILLYMMPMTPFIELFHGMVFNGVVNWINIIILLIQVVIYYMIAYLLLRRNAKNN
jgi:ABC-2 type transport system permease protein